MPSPSTEPKEQTSTSGERLAIFRRQNNDMHVWVYNTECSKVDVEHKIPAKRFTKIFAFQYKLVLIGGIPESRSVDLFNPSTGQISPLPDMIHTRESPTCEATENEIFVFSCSSPISAGAFFSEVYETASGRWSPLPPMIVERRHCSAVNIPDSGVLVIGGVGKGYVFLRTTELLTRRSGEGGEKWQWRPFPTMNDYHSGFPLSVYFQGRVFVVGFEQCVNTMEMLDVVVGDHWTILNLFGPPLETSLNVRSMVRVGSELFVRDFRQSDAYSIDLKISLERPNPKCRKRDIIPFGQLIAVNSINPSS
ncbi:unnamed protein product [Hymenolepis diminuta]|uniref:Uncharacterized protein n=1 Tax=Hymenolepis diminuta TaxID=6216 RepID=A0A564XZP5_HYMDI|nr:unnamed protein product [Hymenolepis diminuta]